MNNLFHPAEPSGMEAAPEHQKEEQSAQQVNSSQ